MAIKRIHARSPFYIEVAPRPAITYYYALQKCEDSTIGYVSEQTVDDIALENDDRVQDSSLNDYVVVGRVDITEGNYTSVGLVTDTGEVGCVVPPEDLFYKLIKCSDSSTGWLSNQKTTDTTLTDGDRVQGPDNSYYTINGEALASEGTKIGYVTVLPGETGCPAITPPIAPQTIQVNCGGTHSVGTDVGVVTYQVNTPETGTFRVNISGGDVPQKFTLKWNSNEVTTDYIGLDGYDQDLLNEGVPIGEIATGDPSTKDGAFLEINKSASTPNLVELFVNAPLVNDDYSVSFVCPEPAPIVIEETTQINIWFDSSGSMNATLQPLRDMAAGNLKSCLIQFYDNDSAKYDKYVKVRSFPTERTFDRAAQPPTEEGATNCINIIFQDESSLVYYDNSWNVNAYRKPIYDTDITNLRNTLLNNATGYITPIIFQVKHFSSFATADYKDFLQTVQFGTLPDGSNYSLPYNLSDLTDRLKFYYDVEKGITYASDPTYYRNLIIQAINDLGFSLTCP